MPRQQKNRRQRPTFPLLGLPNDIQVRILGDLDLVTLQNTIVSVPHARELFLSCPTSILQRVLGGMSTQIRNLLLTICSIINSIEYDSQSTPPSIENFDAFFEKSLDTEGAVAIAGIEHDPLHVLDTLCQIDDEISSLVEDFAQDIYHRACHRENPFVLTPPCSLSAAEEHCMRRAFYRLGLFGALFYDFADYFSCDLQHGYASFFDRLGTWEIDEMMTAYLFCFRERRYIRMTSYHDQCTYDSLVPWGNEDWFNCLACRGECTPPTMGLSQILWRDPQPFWHAARGNYVDAQCLCALPDQCPIEPVKLWNEVPRTDEPNNAWRSWAVTLRRDGRRAATDFVEDYQSLGFCFWDKGRILNEWSSVVGTKWLSPWCGYCQGACDLGDEADS